MEIWIDSSSTQGKVLYESVGWKDVGGLEVELGWWGRGERRVRRTVHMVREPMRMRGREVDFGLQKRFVYPAWISMSPTAGVILNLRR